MLKEGDDGAFAAQARKFQAAVLHHIDEEEQKAFPRLRQNGDPQHSETLVDSVRQFRRSLHFETPG
jgi:hemerythrin-like domain-containing protein